MNPCLICTTPTDETVRGILGDREGVLCTNCQYFCDGNIADHAERDRLNTNTAGW